MARLHSLQQRSSPTVAATPVPHQMPATGSVCAALPGAAESCQAHAVHTSGTVTKQGIGLSRTCQAQPSR